MKKREDHHFDEQIRQKMTHLRPESGVPDWSAFEEKLDAAEALDAGPAEADPREVDEVIFTKMHQYEVPYEPAHWYRMEAKLDEWFSWQQYVLRHKSMELALFLLLFVTCWQYLPEPGEPSAFNGAAEAPYSAVNAEPRTKGKVEGEPQSSATAVQDTKAGFPANRAEQKRYENAQREPRQADETRPSVSSETTQYAFEKTARRSLAPLSPLPGMPVPNALRTKEQAVSPALPLTATSHTLSDWKNLSANSTALLPGKSFKVSAVAADDLGSAKVKKVKQGPTLVVGMFSSADYNHIVVPASSEKRLSESFERAALGYGGGLSLSADFGRFEVETGAIYAARYYPVGIVYVRGSLLSGLRGDELRTTELNMLNIPLHVRYDYFQHNKWRAYVLAGGSLQVAFQSNYYTAEAPQFNFLPAFPPPVTDGPGEESEIDRIRRNGQGWFEGGDFEDNAYLTLNFGFGAERYFSERWSLFVQPVYQHSVHYFKNVDGLGPNNDRINSLSVLIGTRVRLK